MGVIQGTITDQNTGKPINGASIIVVDGSGNATGISTVSDASGNFYLSDGTLDNPSNQVEFNAPGYQMYAVGTTYANNNVSLAPAGLISVNTAAGPVTPVISAAGVVTNVPAGSTTLTSPKPNTTVKPPVTTTNYTWLWVSLLGVGLAVGGYFLFRHKGGGAKAAAN